MDFNDHCATPFAADAHKRVDYNYGLVLGVGEFRTEQGYFLEKHRRHARGLHGYGTVAGLAISPRDTDDGPEIRVSPGLAIDPQGREICVPETRCAPLNGWLSDKQQAGELSALLQGSIPNHVTVYVTLCHRECKTDDVPIPVGPCHSLDRSRVPSRIQDAFELRLEDTPPAQVEEDAMRRLSAVMAGVRVGTGPGALTVADPLVAEIRALAPDQSPPLASDSIPQDFLLDQDHAREILRTALRVFVTEVRPLLIPEGGGCLDGPRDATCVLLGQLDFDVEEVGDAYRVLDGVQISQDDRPLLLSSRALQEQSVETRLPAAGSGPHTLVLGPSVGEPVLTEDAIRASLGEGLSAIRFFDNGAATFNFAPPADLVPDEPLSLRLIWAYVGEADIELPQLTWTATLRWLAVGDDLSAATDGASVFIETSTVMEDRGRLLATASFDIPDVPTPTQPPSMGTLEVHLSIGDVALGDNEIFLVSVELTYSAGGGRP